MSHDGDTQLAQAQELLDWLRGDAARRLGAHVHHALQARRDAWGGLGVFISPHAEPVAKDELLLRIPRALMVEPPPPPPTPDGHTVGAGTAALATLLVQLRLKKGAGGGSPASCAVRRLYLACLPSPAALAQVLPALWVLEPLLDATHHLQQPSPGALLAAVTQRVQRLLATVKPSPSATAALREQLDALAASVADAPGLVQALRGGEAGDAVGGEALLGEGDGAAGGRRSGEAGGAQLLTSLEQLGSSALACWAQGVAWTRAINLWAGPTLVPGFDFINHHAPPNVMCMARTQDAEDVQGATEGGDGPAPNEERQAFECWSIKQLAPDQELHWVYSSHAHDAGWLCSYGFVPSDRMSSQPAVFRVAPDAPQNHDGADAQQAAAEADAARLALYDQVLRVLQQPEADGGILGGALELPPGLRASLALLLGRERAGLVQLMAAAQEAQAGCASESDDTDDTDDADE